METKALIFTPSRPSFPFVFVQVVRDTVGRWNLPSPEAPFTVDRIPPMVLLQGPTSEGGEGVVRGDFLLTFVWSEPLLAFNASSVQVSG